MRVQPFSAEAVPLNLVEQRPKGPRFVPCDAGLRLASDLRAPARVFVDEELRMG